MDDRTLVCKDCRNKFIFTVAEQEFYKEKGFHKDPVDVLHIVEGLEIKKINQ